MLQKEFIQENNMEDFEYESRKIKFGCDPNRPPRSFGIEYDPEPVPEFNEAIRVLRDRGITADDSIG